NRKHTSLTATLVLGTAFTAVWFWLILFQAAWPLSLPRELSDDFYLLAGFGVANAVLYPSSREIYFRTTAFVPRVTAWGGGPLWMTFGLLLLILRFAAF